MTTFHELIGIYTDAMLEYPPNLVDAALAARSALEFARKQGNLEYRAIAVRNLYTVAFMAEQSNRLSLCDKATIEDALDV